MRWSNCSLRNPNAAPTQVYVRVFVCDLLCNWPILLFTPFIHTKTLIPKAIATDLWLQRSTLEPMLVWRLAFMALFSICKHTVRRLIDPHKKLRACVYYRLLLRFLSNLLLHLFDNLWSCAKPLWRPERSLMDRASHNCTSIFIRNFHMVFS